MHCAVPHFLIGSDTSPLYCAVTPPNILFRLCSAVPSSLSWPVLSPLYCTVLYLHHMYCLVSLTLYYCMLYLHSYPDQCHHHSTVLYLTRYLVYCHRGCLLYVVPSSLSLTVLSPLYCALPPPYPVQWHQICTELMRTPAEYCPELLPWNYSLPPNLKGTVRRKLRWVKSGINR